MRIKKSLFYKVESKESMEYHECTVKFHKNKSSSSCSRNKPREDSNNSNKHHQEKAKNKGLVTHDHFDGSVSAKTTSIWAKNKDRVSKSVQKERDKEEDYVFGNRSAAKRTPALNDEDHVFGNRSAGKRTPTFNELTDPYHLPFCLDIYITKGSVRACIVHRITSKVVAVAHSISKDMKFDLKSRKDVAACAAVGGALAQRAVADDIYNVVYTPRKGERIEGKLEVVLQSIIDNGIDVRVKLKQKMPIKRNMGISNS